MVDILAEHGLVRSLSDDELLELYKQWKVFRHHKGFITDDMPMLRDIVDKYADALEKQGVDTAPIHVLDDHLLEEIADRWASSFENSASPLLWSVPFPVPEGTPAWYVDFEENRLDRATTVIVAFKDGKCDSVSMDFPDLDDFDELIGDALGKEIFFSKRNAEEALSSGSRCTYAIKDGRLIETPAN